ncbi:MAG: aminodeoxychorismate synthase component I [Burkholderiales bacterium]|nr:aminodeoxychorismate synthase component I [Burkholderiales bacterium]
MRIEELPYHADTAALFEAVADEPWAVFLDSGRHDPARSRYDIVAAAPWATLVTRGPMTEIRSGEGVRLSPEDPFQLLREMLGEKTPAHGTLPFHGGAIGYFGYDLGRRLERLPATARDDEALPEMAIGIYDWALVIDHTQRRAWLASPERSPATATLWGELRKRFSAPAAERARRPFRTLSEVRSSFTPEQYVAAFDRVMRYIEDGDCYQVNLAQRFEALADGDPWTAYQALRIMNPAPFAAYLNLPFAQVLSASPERFLQVRGPHVLTQPIKGTRPRVGHPRLDAQMAEDLRVSEKDRAENVMIVDLLRNDLAKSCRLGSVRVPRLFEVQSFPSVHHLVSCVEGELAPGRDALDLLRGCFPGGSITGAPKLRAMEIIEELEPYRRGLYCGSIAYLGCDGAMDSSIAIRTLVYRRGRLLFWAGGGLVADSQAQAEYQETLDKAAPFLRLVQQCAGVSGVRRS